MSHYTFYPLLTSLAKQTWTSIRYSIAQKTFEVPRRKGKVNMYLISSNKFEMI